MSWLDTLLDRGLEAMEPAGVAAPIARPAPEIKEVCFQTRAPRGEGDLGEIAAAFYSVADGVLTMHDEDGKATGATYRLRSDEDPRKVAGRLGKDAWSKARGESDFNRPLGYDPLGNA